MENLFSRIGKTAVRASVKILATVCAGIISVIEAAGGKSNKKGGN